MNVPKDTEVVAILGIESESQFLAFVLILAFCLAGFVLFQKWSRMAYQNNSATHIPFGNDLA